MVCCAMSFRFAVVVGVACFILLGCATNSSKSASEARMWQAQLQRQQLVAREAGRIGYIGNAGPALGTTLPSGHGM
jgi:outer membrane biogenesis lipoprotein LolB